jgi:hypothetical protein
MLSREWYDKFVDAGHDSGDLHSQLVALRMGAQEDSIEICAEPELIAPFLEDSWEPSDSFRTGDVGGHGGEYDYMLSTFTDGSMLASGHGALFALDDNGVEH